MSIYTQMIGKLTTPEVMGQFSWLYGNREGQMLAQLNRHKTVLIRHEKQFDAEGPVWLISAPGRVEIGGNHTDHNHGRVLAAAANLDTLAAVSPRDDMIVNVFSEGHAPQSVDLSGLDPVAEEAGTSAAMIRGVAAGMQAEGHAIGGFDAVMTSTVASGSGLSSSAAYEVLIAAIFDRLYGNSNMDFVTQAKIGQRAENVYFGKPSGLLDQMASAAGGLVTVDFCCDEPDVQPIAYDFAAKDFALVVVATGGSHADLTSDYAAIPAEMKQVAAHFGKQYLREVMPDVFFADLRALYGKVPDRALLRAMHFFRENERVLRQVDALRRDDLWAFLWEIKESGRSSFEYLQNVWCKPGDQSLSLALCMAEELLGEEGSWRIHGGGFAGTTLNFVPIARLDRFVTAMDDVFGCGASHVLDIRPVGAHTLQIEP
ncbi:MAG: galactokinase [Clostridia bacterium]|nr:galactokinase [Clostridia bacterium]